ncbi:hypothetical protein C0J50_6599 [Silurus asotus]|uniref:Uncharacterized protein n=1 Tax=Silurus asotus TaxID=30991 RepID=A0AAD5A357_SILAS|nr:hypothetical protein C0J50_6599 [Silurus asotus]
MMKCLYLLSVVFHVAAGGRLLENVNVEGHQDCKGKQEDQTVPDVTYSTVSHVNTAGTARVQILDGDKTEYASNITN